MSRELTSVASQQSSFAAPLARLWSQFWFQDLPTTPIEITRVGVGLSMLLYYGMATPYVLAMWGDDGWVPRALLAKVVEHPLQLSIFYYLSAPWQLLTFHLLFLVSCAALMLGWRTTWVKWLVLIGHISYSYRNPAIVYGFHSIASSLLVILCYAPIGRGLSLDRVRNVRRAKFENLSAHPPLPTSRWGFACTRLVQIQMAVLFFLSATEKLRGDEWWEGDAVWRVFTHVEYYNGELLLGFLAHNYWIVNLATYATILIELAYPFLIWQRQTRPYLLAAAVFLHIQFAILMGLEFFALIMIAGHMSFLRHEWLSWLGLWWKNKIGPVEMIYDGSCGFCRRSMAWFLAFDGLNQISIRNYRLTPSNIVDDDKLEQALYAVLPNGTALPGFEAYRYGVLRVPGLWWLIPFFYVPGASRFFGPRLYGWIAANRARL